MGNEGHFSRWAEEGAFELSFDDGEASLRVPGRGRPEPAESVSPTGASPLGKAPVEARAEGFIQPQPGGTRSGFWGLWRSPSPTCF